MRARRRGEGTGPAAYCGPDRRGRNAGLLAPLPATRLLPITALVAAGAGVPVLFLLARHPSGVTVDSTLAAATALLCVVGGATWLATWRIVGRALHGWVGCAFIVLGLLMLVSNVVSSPGAARPPSAEPLDELVTAAIAGWLAWRGLTDHEVNAALHPMPNLLAAVGTGTAAMGLVNLAGVRGGSLDWAATAPSVVACNGAAAAIWLIVAVAGVRRAAGEGAAPAWTVAAASLLMLGCAARSLEPGTRLATTAALGLTCIGAALAGGTAVARLHAVLAGDGRRQRGVQAALDASRRQAVREQEQLEEWVHDLRNAVAGLRAADAVLRAVAPSGAAERAELADAVTAELARLDALVDPTRGVQVADVCLEEVLEPIVTAERALGARVTMRLGGLRVRADRASLCRVLQNLLLNARRYAAGMPVVIDAQRLGDVVELRVRDEGPGVPPHETSALFERGTRGGASAGIAGSGLGLHVARTLARAMGGEMALHADARPGCCIVLTLPSADRAGVPRTADLDPRPGAQAVLEPAV